MGFVIYEDGINEDDIGGRYNEGSPNKQIRRRLNLEEVVVDKEVKRLRKGGSKLLKLIEQVEKALKKRKLTHSALLAERKNKLKILMTMRSVQDGFHSSNFSF